LLACSALYIALTQHWACQIADDFFPRIRSPYPPTVSDLGLEANHPVVGRPSIIILQHFSSHDDRVASLQNLSMRQHERYAAFWGYTYAVSLDEYVTGGSYTVRQRQTNKAYALLSLVLAEVAKGEAGADWIM
jgi:hypothetical protein